jgi:hypothetical protein
MIQELELLEPDLPDQQAIEDDLHIEPVQGDHLVGGLEGRFLEPSPEGGLMNPQVEVGLPIVIGNQSRREPILLVRGQLIGKIRGKHRQDVQVQGLPGRLPLLPRSHRPADRKDAKTSPVRSFSYGGNDLGHRGILQGPTFSPRAIEIVVMLEPVLSH